MSEQRTPYRIWRVGKDRNRVGDPPRLKYTDSKPTSYNGRPWCDACQDGYQDECYCTRCKGTDPAARGRHAGCYCWLNRQFSSMP